MMTWNFSIGINGYDVSSNDDDDDDNLYLRVILKIKFPFNQSILMAMSILSLLLNCMF